MSEKPAGIQIGQSMTRWDSYEEIVQFQQATQSLRNPVLGFQNVAKTEMNQNNVFS